MKFFWFILPLVLCAEESFISDYEYGEMLYTNPRGVSCSECHGKNGEGKTIVEYQDIDGKKAIKGSDIRKKTLEEMINAVSSYHKVMPRYYLTDDEVKAIYDFLKKKNEDYLKTN
jgi:mono/diheme cytochrome c family protein